MKRAISMLVAIVMVLSMIPNVFAASETAIIVEDISSIAVELNADNGYYAEYSWTPSDNGELSLYQYTEKEIEMIVTQGENSASSYTEEGTYGFAVSLDVTAGEEVIIAVINFVEEDETFEISGTFTKKAGMDQNNPIFLNALENVVDNKGTQWYAGYFSGTNMNITGPEGYTVTYNGEVTEDWWGDVSMPVTSANPRMPVVFAITGDGQFSISFAYPEGSSMNPAVLSTEMANYAYIEAGSQGYFYTWTAPAAGKLTLEFRAEDADWNPLGWSYQINNLTTYAYGDTQWSDSDPVVNPAELTVAAGDEIQIVANTYDPANPWTAPAGDMYITATFACETHGEPAKVDNYDGTHNVVCPACGTVFGTEEHTFTEGFCACGAEQDGTETNPRDLTNDLLYEDDFTAVVTVPANTTFYCMAYRVNGMVMTINGGEGVTCTTDGMMTPYTWTIVNDSNEDAQYVIVVIAPVGTNNNPEVLFRPNYINVNIPEGNTQGYYYKWTANAEGTLKLTCPTVEGVSYDVNMLNKSTYQQVWLQDSTDGTISLDVKAGEEVVIQVAVMPDDNWNIPALQTGLTGEFIFPIGHQMNPEILFRPSYINVNIPEGNTQGYFYKWTANADGELKLTCPAVEGVNYDVNMTNMSTYQQVWLQDSTDGTITLAVKAGDEIIIQVCALPDASWNTPALSVALTGEFIFPIGHQMNPEVLFRPNYINVNIPEGNNQGYFYKWTANAEGSLKLTCPTVEGVNYDVNMTNMSTYQQVWLQDSTDGTITLAVKAGDEVIIQVAVMPDENWNIPALQTALTGEFSFPMGSQMNPEKLEELNWYYGNVAQAEGDIDGYYYTYTANAEGVATFYFGYSEQDLTGYELDIIVTNMNTYAQMSLLQDGVDNYGMELQVPVNAGDELQIQIVAVKDAEGNYNPAAEMTWCGNFAYPQGSQQNPINLEWEWNETYTAATATVTVEAGKTVYYSANAGMILTINGEAAEMDEMGTFSITNAGEAEATYALAQATPVGEYSNPEVIEALPFADTNSLAEDKSYNYIWTAAENGTVVLTITEGANITADLLTYVEDSEWPISEQFELATPTIDENWNYTGWDVAEKLVIDVVAGQQLKIQVSGLTDWDTWMTPAVDYTLNMTFAVEEPAAITAQPQAVTANSGDTVQFKVETTGEVVSYKWEYRKIYKWFATEMEGYNTDTLNVKVTGARNGYDYRCTITFADGTVLVTEPAELTVNSTIVITDHPNNQAVALGYKGQFTALAEGDGIQYAWQYSRNGETWAYTQMEGYTKPTVLIETTAARDGYMYRCEIKDATGDVAYTEVATLTVLHYTVQPQDVRTEAGNTVTFSVETNAPVVRYEWQYSKDGVKWTNTTMTGYNTATLTVAATATRDGYQYRCVITGAKDSKAYSKAATLYIGAPAQIAAQPESVTAEAGATVTFSVEATNVLTYQWQYSKDGANWYTTSMTGATTDTLAVAVTASRNGYQYRCQITGTDGEVIYTNAATLTVG